MKIRTSSPAILSIGLLVAALCPQQTFARDHILVNNTIDSFLGLQNLEYEYKVAEHLSVGLIGQHASGAKQQGIDLNGNAIGGIARIYCGQAFDEDAWFVSFSATRANFDARIVSGGTVYTGKSGNVTTAGGGYHWFWDSFNVSLGLTLAHNSKITLTDSSGNRYKDKLNTHTGIELKIGGSF